MKFLPFLVLAVLLAACSTPEDQATAHQRRLWREAHENFLALKAQERRSAPPPAESRSIARSGKMWRADAPAPRRSRRTDDDTVYYWNVPRQPDSPPAHYTAGELRYARELAKNPDDLTSEERTWARTRY